MITLCSHTNTYIPNILHFQGKSKKHYSVIMKQFSEKIIQDNPKIHIVTCATDESESPLIKQLKKNHINYKNCFASEFYTKWDNTMKIQSICDYIDSLSEKELSELYLILDAYDTVIQSLDRLPEKLGESGKNLMFNATKHNWPEITVDRMTEREFRGDFRYFNAGVCIGYGYAIKDFYKKCLEILYKNISNPWKSEQYILRTVFSEYSESPGRTVDFDYPCKMFQTFGSTRLEKIDEDKYKVL